MRIYLSQEEIKLISIICKEWLPLMNKETILGNLSVIARRRMAHEIVKLQSKMSQYMNEGKTNE